MLNNFNYGKWLTIFLFIVYLSNINLIGNNIQTTNLNITNTNIPLAYSDLNFDINWDNSWRDVDNWDAAWIFVKFRITNSSDAWSHATINYVDGISDGHTPTSGATITTSSDSKGIFLYRTAIGTGHISFPNNTIRWNYGVDGLDAMDNVELKIFAIEMVYVPEGAFYLGDGQTNPSDTYGNFELSNTGTPYFVANENAITIGGSGAGSLGNNDTLNVSPGGINNSVDDFDDNISHSLPAAFPKGFNAFYCMKYEFTQQQFVDMVNCSTPTQQTQLTTTTHFYANASFASQRYGISESGGVYSTTEQFLPMIFCDWIRAAAYADWAALRPMTELEFEKACRGFDAAVVNEFAWGNANVDLSDNLVINNFGLTNEGLQSGYDDGGTNGNAWVRAGVQSMPYIARGGLFAADAGNSGRISSGATTWGIMDMSGNAWERTVSVGHSEGRKFTGQHGDGNLNSNGYADITLWPGSFGGPNVNSNVGVGYRGGALAYPTPNLETNARVSSRRLSSAFWNTVILDDGARFIRSAE